MVVMADGHDYEAQIGDVRTVEGDGSAFDGATAGLGRLAAAITGRCDGDALDALGNAQYSAVLAARQIAGGLDTLFGPAVADAVRRALDEVHARAEEVGMAANRLLGERDSFRAALEREQRAHAMARSHLIDAVGELELANACIDRTADLVAWAVKARERGQIVAGGVMRAPGPAARRAIDAEIAWQQSDMVVDCEIVEDPDWPAV